MNGILFQVDTLDAVNATLQQINERFDKDLMIETFASIPDDFKQCYTDEEREKFYDGWSIAEGRHWASTASLFSSRESHAICMSWWAMRRENWRSHSRIAMNW